MKKHRIGVVTTTRAEYGLLKRLIKLINDDYDSELVLFVTGTHLMEDYGYTIKYIKEDGFPIAKTVKVDIDTSSPSAISKTMGNYFLAFSEVFKDEHVDFLIVLGDRYELIPICFCAANEHIPIGHISGGEVTEGAIDDAVRHSITKLSFLHFPACETYRKRIIQLGENPERVFNVGDPGVENVKKMDLLSEDELRNLIGLEKTDLYYAVLFHPITLDDMKPVSQVQNLLRALNEFDRIKFVMLKSNADMGGMQINSLLEEYANSHDNCVLLSSLKIEEFLSLQKYSMGLIGNSSSGIVETPCFGIPTINIGDRQRGRLLASSIISCKLNTRDIVDAIKKSMDAEFRKIAKHTNNPYGSGETASEILRIVKSTIYDNTNLKKCFYDVKENGI